SNMVGLLVAGARASEPSFGNVFLGESAPVLAYHVSPDRVRVMFDIPGSTDAAAPVAYRASLASVPEPFRASIATTLQEQRPVSGATYSLVPEAVAKGRVVFVGDAAGCCHPLTATGLTVCTRDAMRLRSALEAARGDVPSALARYARLRRGP